MKSLLAFRKCIHRKRYSMRHLFVGKASHPRWFRDTNLLDDLVDLVTQRLDLFVP